MFKVPSVVLQKDFTATGTLQYPEADGNGVSPGMSFIPAKWSLQVTGLDATNAKQTPTSWDVIVQPSLDLIGFNDMTAPMLEHVNTANGNGDVVWAGTTSIAFFPVRALIVHVKSLVLGASATKIRVTLVGC